MARRTKTAEGTLPSDEPLSGDGGISVAETPAPESSGQSIVEAIAEATRMPEDRPAETRQEPKAKSAQRGWSQRYQQPAQFRWFEDRDQTGKTVHIFQFTLQKNPETGKEEMPQAMLDVIHKHKKTEDGYNTGLHFESKSVDPKHGPCWKLPNTPQGRDTAIALEAALSEFAQKAEAGLVR